MAAVGSDSGCGRLTVAWSTAMAGAVDNEDRVMTATTCFARVVRVCTKKIQTSSKNRDII